MSTRYLHNFYKDDAFGGNTFAMEIVDGRLFVGVAHCSEHDQYDKAKGRDIATAYLDELKNAYNEHGYEGIFLGDGIPRLTKVTGFVVDDEAMYHMIASYNEEWEDVLRHITVDVIDFDYMAIEGAELKRMLVYYYNNIIDTLIEGNGWKPYLEE